MNILLTKRSKSDLQTVFYFLQDSIGPEKAIQQTEELVDWIHARLSLGIEAGMIDDQFKHLKSKYFKVLKGNYRVTYRKEKGAVYVVRIFDMRRRPSSNL